MYDFKPARLIVLNNITEGINAEYGKFLEKVSDLMIASTSHDMRTPLNTIQSMQTLMGNNIADSKIKNWLNIA